MRSLVWYLVQFPYIHVSFVILSSLSGLIIKCYLDLFFSGVNYCISFSSWNPIRALYIMHYSWTFFISGVYILAIPPPTNFQNLSLFYFQQKFSLDRNFVQIAYCVWCVELERWEGIRGMNGCNIIVGRGKNRQSFNLVRTCLSLKTRLPFKVFFHNT